MRRRLPVGRRRSRISKVRASWREERRRLGESAMVWTAVAVGEMQYWQRGGLLSFVPVALFPERVGTLSVHVNAPPLLDDSTPG